MPLTKLKNFLVPQDDIFFKLMEKQAETAHTAAQELSKLLEDYNKANKESKKIRDLEHQGDELMRNLYTALNKTFIVPIDHTDISALANALDDILDLIDQTATLMVAYEITTPTPAMIQLTRLLVSQTSELQKAVAAINHSRTYHKVPEYCNKIKHFEIKADEVYVQAIAALFKKTDAIEVLKQKEILDCLESATDKTDKAAQNISDIVMKHS
jgi:predicted phosphate transport protein (TIGR00153 family)